MSIDERQVARRQKAKQIAGPVAVAAWVATAGTLVMDETTEARGSDALFAVFVGALLLGIAATVTWLVARSEPATAPATPEQARQRRSSRMVTVGAIVGAWGFAGLAFGGAGALPVLVAVLGIALFVGGLVVRR